METSGNRHLLFEELATKDDLASLKTHLLIGIKGLLDASSKKPARKWLKSHEVEKLLGISTNTLQSWRDKGIVPYSPMGGIMYYDPDDIEELLKSKKRKLKNWS